jgi:shikimate kinase
MSPANWKRIDSKCITVSGEGHVIELGDFRNWDSVVIYEKEFKDSKNVRVNKRTRIMTTVEVINTIRPFLK